MEALIVTLLFAALACLVALLIGMISPRRVLRSTTPTRAKVLRFYISAFFLCSMGAVVAESQTDEAKQRAAERARVEAEAEAAAELARQEQMQAEAEQREINARREAEDRAAAEQARKEQLAAEAKQQAEEEARCRADLRCWGEKHQLEASIVCKGLVERLALNSFQWTDDWLEPKFSHYRWQDKAAGIITIIGDKIQYQNGFGAMINHVYECDYDPDNGRVIDVRAQRGRL